MIKYLLLLLTLSTSLVFADDRASQALEDACTFAKKKEYKKALERHEWYHENALKIDPAEYGVRLSFALSYWKALADQYPPAMKSLIATRDKADKAVRAGTAHRGTFHDVISINSILQQSKKSMDLFKFLDKKFPNKAKECFEMADELFMEQEEYLLYAKYCGDLKVYLTAKIQKFKQDSSESKAEYIQYYKNALKRKGAMIAKVAQKLGKKQLAKELEAMTAEALK